ncbi:MAG: acetyltransferase [Clostridiales Family XIII bacterium]|nr:acetyltransferase [Clostridiales Family XIII bacterium]
MTAELKDLYIIGAGDFGRETADTVHEINRIQPTYRIAGFIDDNPAMHRKQINGIDVPGGREYLLSLAQRRGGAIPYAIIAIADPMAKIKIARSLEGSVIWENIIHPLALIKGSARIGQGNIIQHFSSVSSNAVVGDHCLINCNCVVGHDVNLGHNSALMPFAGIMGDCVVENRVFIGAGAIVIPGVNIGKDAVIGAGAVVLEDVEAGATVVGNPAQRIK